MASVQVAEGDVLASRYRLLRRIGAGPHGVVFEAEQIGLRRRVAVKVVASDFDCARLAREASHAARLDDAVLAVFESCLDHDPPFIVSELAAGSLASFAGRAMGEPTAVRVARGVLDVLSKAHDIGLIHGDLRPSNIFFDGAQVKLSDFGFATDDPRTDAAATNLLSTKSVVGYRAPERIRGSPPTARSDLFAVGVCLYELTTGRRPFQAATPIDEITAILGSPTPRMRGASASVITRALEKDPAARFASAAEMRDALGSRRKLWPLALGIAIALATAVGVYAALEVVRVEHVAVTPSLVADAAPPPASSFEPLDSAASTSASTSASEPAPRAPAARPEATTPPRVGIKYTKDGFDAFDATEKRQIEALVPRFDACVKKFGKNERKNAHLVVEYPPGARLPEEHTVTIFSNELLDCLSLATRSVVISAKQSRPGYVISIF